MVSEQRPTLVIFQINFHFLLSFLLSLEVILDTFAVIAKEIIFAPYQMVNAILLLRLLGKQSARKLLLPHPLYCRRCYSKSILISHIPYSNVPTLDFDITPSQSQPCTSDKFQLFPLYIPILSLAFLSQPYSHWVACIYLFTFLFLPFNHEFAKRAIFITFVRI